MSVGIWHLTDRRLLGHDQARQHQELYNLFRLGRFDKLILEWAPKLRQPVKTHFSLNGEESHEPISTEFHKRV